MTQVFLLTTGTAGATWPDPGNWNPANTVECIGAGARGGIYQAVNPNGGGGGGGGAYGKASNMALTFPVNYWCFAGNTTNTNFAVSFNTAGYSNPSPAPNSVYAGCAPVNPGGGGGGTGATAFSPAGFAGGNGGSTSNSARWAGGGGGGAGGPHGAGSTGSNATSATAFGAGGASDGGTVTGPSTVAAAGNKGTQFDASHGTGTGACGGNSATQAGGAGGQYGGGGGGSYSTTQSVGGDGLIIITYTPFIPSPPAVSAMIIP